MTYQAVDWISQNALATPDNLAQVDLASGRRYSYAQMDARVGRVAGALRAKGLQPGDRAGYLALNSTDVSEFIFGCWRVGVIPVAINFRLTPPEIATILKDSGARLVFADTPFAPIADALPDYDWWMSTGLGEDSAYERDLARADIVMDYHPQAFEDQCLLMYSSGTTGAPKGVIITHGMMYFCQSGGAQANGLAKDMVALTNMPLFHIAGLNVTTMPAFWIGGTVLMMRVFDPQATLDCIAAHDPKPTGLFMVPAAYNAIRHLPGVDDVDFSAITSALCGAETVPVSLIQWWAEKGIIIQEGYGMTETAAPGTLIAKSDMPAMAGSCGRAIFHTHVSVHDVETGEEVPTGEPGEIWITGNVVSPGYWNRPEATDEVFITHNDGRRTYKTGDVGRIDDRGYVYIEDRIKDMYISGGENVYPAEIENLLYQMEAIAEVAVVGVPDDRWGEVGCVCAVVKSGASLELDEVLAHVEGQLASFKTPRHLHVMEALPRGGTGKVLKYELRKTLAQMR